jgi:3-deoxy-D-manno-octulosonic-acid transferase
MREGPEVRKSGSPEVPRSGASRSDWALKRQFLGGLYAAASPLAALYAANRVWLRGKRLVGLREKLTGEGEPVAPGQVLVHGVSLGETMLMRPLVPHLERIFAARCLLTTTTGTGWQALGEQFAGHQRAFLPLDRPEAVRRFLARARPRLVVLLELEIWPGFIGECQARGIPVLLLNARCSESSFRGYRSAGPLLRPLLARLGLVLAQNALWAARLAALGVRRERLAVPGSLKADLVKPATPEAAATLAGSLGLTSGQPVLLLASTSAGADGRPDEEGAVLSDRLGWWREQGWRVVICPRHPERGPQVAALVARLGGTARRSSQGERLSGADEVLVVDEIGKLGALYAWTAAQTGIAVVGGSLGSGRRGQNMLEAAAAGCCTAVGADTRNFPDAMALLREGGGVVELSDPPEPTALTLLAGDGERRRRLGAAAQLAWRSGQGALARTVARLERYAAALP